MDEFVRIQKYADALGISTTSLRNMCNDGIIVPHHILPSGVRYFDMNQLKYDRTKIKSRHKKYYACLYLNFPNMRSYKDYIYDINEKFKKEMRSRNLEQYVGADINMSVEKDDFFLASDLSAIVGFIERGEAKVLVLHETYLPPNGMLAMLRQIAQSNNCSIITLKERS